jgi:hypothetical protein
MHELARRGRLWATLISGYHHYVMVRVHADFDNPRGRNGKYFFEVDGGDIKDMTPKSRLRITLERLRRDYGVRSRYLELREERRELDPLFLKHTDRLTWASEARAHAKEQRQAGVIGWNPACE